MYIGLIKRQQAIQQFLNWLNRIKPDCNIRARASNPNESYLNFCSPNYPNNFEQYIVQVTPYNQSVVLELSALSNIKAYTIQTGSIPELLNAVKHSKYRKFCLTYQFYVETYKHKINSALLKVITINGEPNKYGLYLVYQTPVLADILNNIITQTDLQIIGQIGLTKELFPKIIRSLRARNILQKDIAEQFNQTTSLNLSESSKTNLIELKRKLYGLS